MGRVTRSKRGRKNTRNPKHYTAKARSTHRICNTGEVEVTKAVLESVQSLLCLPELESKRLFGDCESLSLGYVKELAWQIQERATADKRPKKEGSTSMNVDKPSSEQVGYYSLMMLEESSSEEEDQDDDEYEYSLPSRKVDTLYVGQAISYDNESDWVEKQIILRGRKVPTRVKREVTKTPRASNTWHTTYRIMLSVPKLHPGVWTHSYNEKRFICGSVWRALSDRDKDRLARIYANYGESVCITSFPRKMVQTHDEVFYPRLAKTSTYRRPSGPLFETYLLSLLRYYIDVANPEEMASQEDMEITSCPSDHTISPSQSQESPSELRSTPEGVSISIDDFGNCNSFLLASPGNDLSFSANALHDFQQDDSVPCQLFGML